MKKGLEVVFPICKWRKWNRSRVALTVLDVMMVAELLVALVVFLEEDWYYGIEVINEHTLSTL